VVVAEVVMAEVMAAEVVVGLLQTQVRVVGATCCGAVNTSSCEYFERNRRRKRAKHLTLTIPCGLLPVRD